MSSLTLSLLILDHPLPGFLGEKYCRYRLSSSDWILESIQPKQRATSTASLHSMDGWPLPFFQKMSQRAGSVSWCFSSQVRNAAGDSASI